MGNQVHVHPSTRQHGRMHRWRQLSRRRRLFIFFAIFLVTIGVVLAILNILNIIQGTWISILSLIFPALGLVCTSLQWLFPVDPSITPMGPFRGSIGHYPSINPDTIIWRERDVQEVYEKLIDPNISTIVLRGLNGVGTSTLANLVCHYAEENRLQGVGPFIDQALWLYIDANTSIPDLAEELSLYLKKPLPDLNLIAPQYQAEQLFNHLNTSRMRRLIVLDFKNPLDEHSNDALADRPGFKEFLRILNSHSCYCRVLLTSRPWSSESSGYMPDYVQECHARGLDDNEGIELLQKYHIEGTAEELRFVVKLVDGHAGALNTLPSVLSEHSINLTTFIEDHAYVQLWIQEITNDFLDHVYQGLNPIQKELLFAFSVYRKPVTMKAAQAVITGTLSREQMLSALPKLTRHNLFLNFDEKDSYQLHAIVANYAQNHFSGTTNQTNPMKLHEAHRNAARHYQDVVKHHLSLAQQSKRSELLIEAAWHLHKAGNDQDACNLILQENLLNYLL